MKLLAMRDSWLSEVSGIPSYWAEIIPGHGPTELGVGFYSCRVPTAHIAAVRDLCGQGFYVVDTAITLEREPFQPVSGGSILAFNRNRGMGIPLREVESRDYQQLLDIAEESFVCSRFALDPQIPPKTASDIKRAWLGSYFSHARGERVLVAEVGNEAVGFLAVLQQPDVAVIDLIGVKQGERQHGIGRALVRHFCALYKERVVRVGTQAANIPSLRLYQSLGFAVAKTELVLHAHVTGAIRENSGI